MEINQRAKLSVAPMIDWTDRHCRYLHRMLSRHVRLYTEMIAAPALVRGPAARLLRFDPAEHPVAAQIGGSDPAELAAAARIAAAAGYDEINLNVGCPSDRVQSGLFGAVLMRRPALVAECVAAMVEAVDVPVTVKCRLGVDEQEPREVLPDLLERLEAAGAACVVIHARKAWLEGLSPKENREIPPLDHALALEMARAFPGLPIGVNGGVGSLAEAKALLEAGARGVMIGRAAYRTPAAILGPADPVIFGTGMARDPGSAVRAMLPYIDRECAGGTRLHTITRHMLGLFAGRPGARVWRQTLSVDAARPGSGAEVVARALDAVEGRAAA